MFYAYCPAGYLYSYKALPLSYTMDYIVYILLNEVKVGRSFIGQKKIVAFERKESKLDSFNDVNFTWLLHTLPGHHTVCRAILHFFVYMYMLVNAWSAVQATHASLQLVCQICKLCTTCSNLVRNRFFVLALWTKHL